MSKKKNRLTKWDKMLSELSRLKFERNEVLNTINLEKLFEDDDGQKYVQIPVESYTELASLLDSLRQAIYVIALAEANGVTPENVDVLGMIIRLNQLAGDLTPLDELDSLDRYWQMQKILPQN